MSETVAELLARFSADTTDFESGAARVQNGMQAAGQSVQSGLDRIGDGFIKVGTTAGVMGGAILAPFGLAVNAAIEFESAFAGVVKTVDATDDELARLRGQLLEMAVSDTNPLAGLDNAAVTLAGIAELGGQLGIATDDLIDFTQTIGELAIATNLTSEEAAVMVAQFGNIMGMPTEDIDNFGAALVELGNTSATTEKDILEMATRLAGIGGVLGLEPNEILGLASAMASVGIQAEAGGTAMTTIFTNMDTAVGKGGTALEVFAETAQTSADDFVKIWEANPVDALQAFLDGFDQLSSSEQTAVLEELGLSGIRVADTIRRLAGNTDLLSSALETSASAWYENTALHEEANARFETTQAQVNLAKNQINDLAIVVGDLLLPAINDLLPQFGEFVLGVKTYAEGNPEMVLGIVKLGVGLLALSAVLVPVGILFKAAATAVGLMTAGLGLLTLPMWAVVGVGALLGAAIYKIGDALGMDWGLLGDVMVWALTGAFNQIIAAAGRVEGAINGIISLIDVLNGKGMPNYMTHGQQGFDADTEAFLAMSPEEQAAAAAANLAGLAGMDGVTVEYPFGSGLAESPPDYNPGAGANMSESPGSGEILLPGYARGGGIGAGTWAIVGEQGPELFRPHSSGEIIPNHLLGAATGGSSRPTIALYNASFYGVRDISQFYDLMEREASMRA